MAVDEEGPGAPPEKGGEASDPRLYSVRISRVTGIEWGTDLSFSWVYVRALEPGGAADKCGEISMGDQVIDELQRVSFDKVVVATCIGQYRGLIVFCETSARCRATLAAASCCCTCLLTCYSLMDFLHEFLLGEPQES